MQHIWADRGKVTAWAILTVAGLSGPGWIFGQARSGPGGAPPSVGGTRSPGNPNTGFPNTPNGNFGNTNNPLAIPQRTIPLTGRVMFDDGTPPNHEIRIEKVCGGQSFFEAYTDGKGRFSFNLDNTAHAGFDSADEDSGQIPGTNPQQPIATLPGGRVVNMQQQNRYWNCELRATYPGYRSDVIDLSTRRSLDDPDVGTMVLHRLANVKGTTVSVTSALAPKHAQKEYEKGMQLMQKGKIEEAEQHLESATETYPKYAEAWFALGQIQQKENRLPEAQKSFLAAAEADHKFVGPYNSLAYISGQKGKWDDAAKYSAQVIDLDPVEFPSAFWLNALANYNLKNLDQAQKSAGELVKIDTAHHFPMAEMMLAEINMNKGNLAEAAVHLKSYLALEPNAKNAEALKQELLKIEQAKAGKPE